MPSRPGALSATARPRPHATSVCHLSGRAQRALCHPSAGHPVIRPPIRAGKEPNTADPLTPDSSHGTNGNINRPWSSTDTPCQLRGYHRLLGGRLSRALSSLPITCNSPCYVQVPGLQRSSQRRGPRRRLCATTRSVLTVQKCTAQTLTSGLLHPHRRLEMHGVVSVEEHDAHG